ncbi:MAG: fumarylacetoacetate hydrolase family protein [Rhodospirillales bacterium]|nr:fumarylacetoacetate hydrolase family protein [Rhodospirillales bacterium]
MARWIRFENAERIGFGTVEDGTITVFEGEMFAKPVATSETLAWEDVKVLTPCVPTKMVALWNNFHALAKKLELTPPEEPLYFLKASSSFLATGETIRRPKSYDGRVVYEGELGIVIGRTCRSVPEDAAGGHIFGYTCINDVTAVDLLNKDPTFAQWTRAKSFDGFGAFGPVIATGLDPAVLTIRTVLNGDERQNYPVADMVFPPARLVSRISQDLTLEPGDVIACGTSLGVGSMKAPSNAVEVTIEGIGTLANVFEQ